MGEAGGELRVLVLGDGPNEVAKEWHRLLAAGELPALPRLVHRLLGGPHNARYEMGLFRQVAHARGKGSAFEKKTKAAILYAGGNDFHAVVIVRDRDRHPSSKGCLPIMQARDSMKAADNPPCAVGCAIETFDAWMIADGKSVGAAGGNAARSHPDPESLDREEGTGRHPKDRAIDLFGGAGILTEAYAKVALHVDLELLRKQCPKGFAPFAADVEERILPLVCPAANS